MVFSEVYYISLGSSVTFLGGSREKKNHTHNGHLKPKTLTQTLACASPSLGLVIHQVEMKRSWDLVSPK